MIVVMHQPCYEPLKGWFYIDYGLVAKMLAIGLGTDLDNRSRPDSLLGKHSESDCSLLSYLDAQILHDFAEIENYLHRRG